VLKLAEIVLLMVVGLIFKIYSVRLCVILWASPKPASLHFVADSKAVLIFRGYL
jgi:hypothetical protein